MRSVPTTPPTAPLSGRRAQAARNDELILAAARAVFVADPEAPIAAVAERAGVGISALYRRHGSKEDLLRRLCADGLQTYIAAAHAALDRDDPWPSFAGFVRDVVDADVHSLTISLAGTFTPTEELNRSAGRADELGRAIVDRAHAAGVLRPDLVVEDLGLVFEQIASVRTPDEERTRQLRHRYLAMWLDSVRVPAEHRPLPGPPPQPGEFVSRWDKRG
jgi:AcrR family transcriptional regulator